MKIPSRRLLPFALLSGLFSSQAIQAVQPVYTEVSAQSGIAYQAETNPMSAGIGWIDYNNDSFPDLYIPNASGSNRLYRNEGQGRFSDVSQEAGIRVEENGIPVGKGLGVSVVDYDRDGWLDLILANDTVRNFLYHNRGDGSFEEVGAFEGIAYDRNGKATGAMGIDSDYFRNDQELGIFIGNFANEMSSLFVTAAGRPPFADEAVLEGLGPDTRLALTFGVFFFDADLDGRLDLLQANGHLEHEINKVQPSQHYAQPAQLFWNCGCRSGFLPQPAEAVGDLATPLVGRGAAYADIDGDGDLDVLITQNGGPPLLLRNDLALGHHWLRVKLVGQTVNRDAIGARVELRTGDMLQRQQLMPSRSYLSQVEPVLTFGLGTADRIDELADGSLAVTAVNLPFRPAGRAGELLSGVRYTGHGAETHSLVVRGETGTVRWVRGKHNLQKLNRLSVIEY